jgi:hypothetical protein
MNGRRMHASLMYPVEGPSPPLPALGTTTELTVSPTRMWSEGASGVAGPGSRDISLP